MNVLIDNFLLLNLRFSFCCHTPRSQSNIFFFQKSTTKKSFIHEKGAQNWSRIQLEWMRKSKNKTWIGVFFAEFSWSLRIFFGISSHLIINALIESERIWFFFGFVSCLECSKTCEILWSSCELKVIQRVDFVVYVHCLVKWVIKLSDKADDVINFLYNSP